VCAIISAQTHIAHTPKRAAIRIVVTSEKSVEWEIGGSPPIARHIRNRDAGKF
jgi:hypothetical protein